MLKNIGNFFKKAKLPKSKWVRWTGVFIIVAMLAGGGYSYYHYQQSAAQNASSQSTLQTATIRQGDLIIYASGTGTLEADEVSLGFRSSGVVKSILVKVGDKVQKGDLLAQIDDTDAQLKYTQAERALRELTSPASVAAAQQDVTQAELDLEDAISSLRYLISPNVYNWEQKVADAKTALDEAQKAADASPSDQDLQAKLEQAQAAYDSAQKSLNGAWAEWEKNYVPNNFTEKTVNRATRSVEKSVVVPSDTEILQARAAVSEAQARLTEAQYYYDALTGVDIPDDATGTNLSTYEQAQLDLQSAQAALDGTKIYATISGTVTALDLLVGDTVGTGTVVTIADMDHPYLEVFLDESDWKNVNVGEDAQITFDALPDVTYDGSVTQVDPALYVESGTSVIRGLVHLNKMPSKGLGLALGTSAAIDVIGGRAEGAVLVPVEALHKAGDQYAVFVMQNGKPRLRVIDVGIQDLLYAEVKSGLKVGDVVTTGIVETR
jgi:HlyD family secretion protein